MRAREPTSTACMTWRMQARVYVDVGEGVGDDVGAGVGAAVGEAVGLHAQAAFLSCISRAHIIALAAAQMGVSPGADID